MIVAAEAQIPIIVAVIFCAVCHKRVINRICREYVAALGLNQYVYIVFRPQRVQIVDKISVSDTIVTPPVFFRRNRSESCNSASFPCSVKFQNLLTFGAGVAMFRNFVFFVAFFIVNILLFCFIFSRCGRCRARNAVFFHQVIFRVQAGRRLLQSCRRSFRLFPSDVSKFRLIFFLFAAFTSLIGSIIPWAGRSIVRRSMLFDHRIQEESWRL